MQACYPVARRGKSIVWSGVPFHGPSQFKDAVAFYAQSAAQRAFEKGYLGKKKGDEPAIVWLEVVSDALFNNNAVDVRPADNDRYKVLLTTQSSAEVSEVAA